MELVKDRCDSLDSYSVGDRVTVSCNLRGRGWKKDEDSEERFFLSLNAWRIESETSKEFDRPVGEGGFPPPAEDDNLDIGGGKKLPF